MEVAPVAAGDTRTAARCEEDWRQEEAAKLRDHQAAWAVAHGSSTGGSHGTSNPKDPLANIP